MNEMNLTPEELQQLQQLAMMLRKQGGQTGMMGFDQNRWAQMMSNPVAREAGAELAGLASEQAALQMQAMGKPRAIPHGGLKSPLEAASEGFSAGMGMYQMLNAQRAKADAIRNWPKPDPDGGSYRDGQSQKGPMQDPISLRNGTPQAVEVEVDTLNIPVPKAPMQDPMTLRYGVPQAVEATETVFPGMMPTGSRAPIGNGVSPMTNSEVGDMIRRGATVDPYTGQVYFR